MKTSLVTAAFLALLGATAPAALAQQVDHNAHHSAAAADAQLAEGTVRKIDKAGGKLTIAHGPLPSLGMPPMTMVFRVAEPGLLDQVQVGDKIRFGVDKIGGALTVTAIQPAQ